MDFNADSISSALVVGGGPNDVHLVQVIPTVQPRKLYNMAVKCLFFRQVLPLGPVEPLAADTRILQQVRYLLRAHS